MITEAEVHRARCWPAAASLQGHSDTAWCAAPPALHISYSTHHAILAAAVASANLLAQANPLKGDPAWPPTSSSTMSPTRALEPSRSPGAFGRWDQGRRGCRNEGPGRVLHPGAVRSGRCLGSRGRNRPSCIRSGHGCTGLVRTTSMRAWSPDGFSRIVSMIP